MKALLLTDDPQQPIRFQQVEKPKIKVGHCLIKLKAASLNRRDYWISIGKYPGIMPNTIFGSDGSGVVVEGDPKWLGKEVIINPNINWGNKSKAQSSEYSILGMPVNGTFAEYISVPTQKLTEKPAHLSHQEAAAFPLAGLTAYRAVFKKGKVKKNHRVLITGIGGGVAQFALSFSLTTGANVYVTSSEKGKIETCKKLGATGGFNYKNQDWIKEAKSACDGFDVIIDSAGGNALNDYLRLVKPGGKIVVYGSTLGRTDNFDLFRLFWSQASILGTTMGSDAEFREMIDFVGKHRINPIISKVYKLSEGVEAINSMADSKHFGKIVLDIA